MVEALKQDWAPNLDPFKLNEIDGYFYGRGTTDVKEGGAFLVSNFIRLKQEGWIPRRDIILALTADEEGGDYNGVQWLLKNRRDLIDALLDALLGVSDAVCEVAAVGHAEGTRRAGRHLILVERLDPKIDRARRPG